VGALAAKELPGERRQQRERQTCHRPHERFADAARRIVRLRGQHRLSVKVRDRSALALGIGPSKCIEDV